MTLHDPARRLLVERGAAEHVVKGGLEGLVTAWEQTALAAQRGYAQGLEDWRDDVDARQLIDLAWKVALPAQRKSLKPRLEAADARFWKACEAGACTWGATVAARESWSAATHWWYFLAPKKAGRALAQDLAALASATGGSR
ncbi:MAG: hypothetical protein JNK02_09295 [Planctomycetes bacterium]|nr:hypothetical protein [Planctomycetota bacterium]